MKSRSVQAVVRLVPLLLVLAAWQAASSTGLLPKSLLPSAAAVAIALGKMVGIGDFSKIAVIALACLVPIVIATFNGASSVDAVLLWSARARGTSPRRLLWRVVLPAALPQIAAGVRSAIAIAIIVLVSSEFISSEAGLGYLIFSYGGVGAEAAMLAVVLYLALLGYALDRLYVAGLRKAM